MVNTKATIKEKCKECEHEKGSRPCVVCAYNDSDYQGISKNAEWEGDGKND